MKAAEEIHRLGQVNTATTTVDAANRRLTTTLAVWSARPSPSDRLSGNIGCSQGRHTLVNQFPDGRNQSIRDARHKLTLFPPEVHGGQAHGELFDLIDDPWELNNLYDDPAQAAAREKLTLALVHWLATKRRPVTANPMPPPDPQQPGRRGWDEAPKLYASDGRLRRGVIEQLLELGRNRYL